MGCSRRPRPPARCSKCPAEYWRKSATRQLNARKWQAKRNNPFTLSGRNRPKNANPYRKSTTNNSRLSCRATSSSGLHTRLIAAQAIRAPSVIIMGFPRCHTFLTNGQRLISIMATGSQYKKTSPWRYGLWLEKSTIATRNHRIPSPSHPESHCWTRLFSLCRLLINYYPRSMNVAVPAHLALLDLSFFE